MAPQKWPKCDASKWTYGQMERWRRRHFICSSTATSGRHLRATPSAISYVSGSAAARGRAKSCKLMATGAHSKRFHYCHKLRLRRRLRRLRLREIALKNFPAVLFDFRYVIFKWLPKSRAAAAAGSNKMRWQLLCWRALISSLDFCCPHTIPRSGRQRARVAKLQEKLSSFRKSK